MKDHHVPQEHLSAFARRLAEEERSAGTVEKYLRDAGAFLEWLAGAPVNREAVTGWKAHLVRSGYRPATINSMLAALNSLFRFLGSVSSAWRTAVSAPCGCSADSFRARSGS